MSRTTLEAQIAGMAAQLSGSPSARIDPAMPFALLGLDSLSAVELASRLERVSGVDVPAEIVADCGSPRALAAWLHRRARQDQSRSKAQATDPYELMYEDIRTLSRATCDMPRATCDMPRATCGLSRATCNVRGGLRAARTILVTGATGFLGRWIVRELLDTSEPTLFCVVRGEQGRARVVRSLEIAGVPAEAIERRVVTIEGDLTLPHLGLGRDEFDALSQKIDTVCHAAASVNWIHSYASLRAANVLGTRELLRLAGARHAHFHFVSSISTCYAADGPEEVDEGYDALTHLRGLHLGYAQTKAVAEALVRAAAARGLPVTIYRPALISGHSREPDVNHEDLLSLLIRGCLRMGTAPDLDWTLDVLPVEQVARRIVTLSPETGTFHLKHPNPRHWRECVLWMRMYGYPLTLVPFAAWLHQLEGDVDAMTARGKRHPLAPLRRFFTGRPDGRGGLTLPQLYEDVRRTRALSAHTERRLAAARGAEGKRGAAEPLSASERGWGPASIEEDDAGTCPALDGSLLDHYFASFRASGHLSAPSAPIGVRADSPISSSRFDDRLLASLVEPALGAVTRTTLLTRGSTHSIVSDLVAWQSRRPVGLFGYRLDTASGRREVILKVKARDREVAAVGEAVARVCGEPLGSAWHRWQDRLGFAASHLREIAVYRQTDPRVAQHIPRVVGSISDDERGMWAVVLERITGAAYLDSTSSTSNWDAGAIAAAIDGLAALQSVWYGRERDLRGLAWSGFERTATSMAEMSDLWSALAAHAKGSFCAWAEPAIAAIHRRLIAEAGYWWRTLEAAPRTLIHNDFNPRNICLRQTDDGVSLCAYDWELATIGAPQRDLAELLCFVLPHDVSMATVDGWIEFHRRALETECGSSIDADGWRDGFRCSLYDLLVDRLSMYALIHRVRRQSFLPRVVRTWRRLYGFFPLRADA